MITHQRQYHHTYKKIRLSSKLGVVLLFMSLGLGAIDTIWSLYIKHFGFTNSTVGFITSVFIILSLSTSLLATPILEKWNESKIVLITLIITALGYYGIALFPSFIPFIMIAAFLTIVGIVRQSSFNIIFRDHIPSKNLNVAEGFYYEVLNIGWLIGPFIAGFFLISYGFSSVFAAVSLLFATATMTYFSLSLKNTPKKRKSIDRNIFKNCLSFLKNKKIRLPYLMVVGVETWYALPYIYAPLFMLQKGLGYTQITIFIASMVIPLVLSDYAIGKLSTKIGLKKFFVIGFLGLTLISISLFFIKEIYIQLGLILIGSFFSACIDPLQDTFFFKRVTKNEEEQYYPLFKTAFQIGGFIGQFTIAVVLLFFKFKFAYIAMAILMGLYSVKAIGINEDITSQSKI